MVRRRTNRRLLSLRQRPTCEPLEVRLALSSTTPTPVVAMLSATTTNSKSVTVSYQVSGNTLPGALTIAIDRSASTQYNPSSDVLLAEGAFAGNDLSIGTHTVTISVPGGLPIDPAHPYVLAVADPNQTLSGTTETNDVASFRTYVIGAVSHGFEFTAGLPAWETTMANSLKQDGYDVAIPFDWSSTSHLLKPGQAVAAGQKLANDIVTAVNGLKLNPGDVIDLHLIGHSRGAVVVSQAALDLEAMEQKGQLSPLADGYEKITFLDPHPAHNTAHIWASYSPGPIGRAVAAVYTVSQAVMNDPNVIVPNNAADVEVYYQHTLAPNTADFEEHFLSLWGEVPVVSEIGVPLYGGIVHYADLTGIANGHTQVQEWYLQNVVPILSTAEPFVAAGYTGPPIVPPGGFTGPPVGSLAAEAYEISVLYPKAIDSLGVAVSLEQQLAAAESSFAQGHIAQGTAQLAALGLYLYVNRQHINTHVIGL